MNYIIIVMSLCGLIGIGNQVFASEIDKEPMHHSHHIVKHDFEGKKEDKSMLQLHNYVTAPDFTLTHVSHEPIPQNYPVSYHQGTNHRIEPLGNNEYVLEFKKTHEGKKQTNLLFFKSPVSLNPNILSSITSLQLCNNTDNPSKTIITFYKALKTKKLKEKIIQPSRQHSITSYFNAHPFLGNAVYLFLFFLENIEYFKNIALFGGCFLVYAINGAV